MLGETCHVSTKCRRMAVIRIAQARAAANDGSGAAGVKAEEPLLSYTTNEGQDILACSMKTTHAITEQRSMQVNRSNCGEMAVHEENAAHM